MTRHELDRLFPMDSGTGHTGSGHPAPPLDVSALSREELETLVRALLRYKKQKLAQLSAETGVDFVVPERIQRLLASVPPLPLPSAPLPAPFLSPPQQLPGGTPAGGTGDDRQGSSSLQQPPTPPFVTLNVSQDSALPDPRLDRSRYIRSCMQVKADGRREGFFID